MSESTHSAEDMCQHPLLLFFVLGTGHDLAQLEADISARIAGDAPLRVSCAALTDTKGRTNCRNFAFHAEYYITNGATMGNDGC